MTLATNRYAQELKARRLESETRAVPPHLLPDDDPAPVAPSPAAVPDAGLGSIDLRSVTWIPIVTAVGSAGPKGFRVTSARVSLPRDPFATMAASWLRLGALKDRPDVLVLQFVAEASTGALKRHQDGASWGGRALLKVLAARGWTKGEYELVEKSNCWLVTKERVR